MANPQCARGHRTPDPPPPPPRARSANGGGVSRDRGDQQTGSGLYAQLPQLRAMVDSGPPRASTQTIASRQRRNITYGSKAGLRVSLGAGGVPPGTPVSPLGGSAWTYRCSGGSAGARTTRCKTDGAGKAETQMRLSLNRRLRARYPGEPGLLPSSSASLKVGVRPVVTGREQSRHRQACARHRQRAARRRPTAILTLKRRTPSGRLVRVSRRTREAAQRQPAHQPAGHAAGALPAATVGASDARNLSARSNVAEFRME